MEGSGYGILCGNLGFECIPLGVKACRDVVFDVLEDQFLKSLNQNELECHRQ